MLHLYFPPFSLWMSTLNCSYYENWRVRVRGKKLCIWTYFPSWFRIWHQNFSETISSYSEAILELVVLIPLIIAMKAKKCFNQILKSDLKSASKISIRIILFSPTNIETSIFSMQPNPQHCKLHKKLVEYPSIQF